MPQPHSIKQIHAQLQKFDTAARHAADHNGIAAAWKRIFDQELSPAAAKGFAQYYREMRSKTSRKMHKKSRRVTRRHRRNQRAGGTLTPAPYPAQAMVPGMPVQTYGNFPVEVDTDPASIKDLDVYFHDSLPLSKAGYWPSVPANMGSNKVGGSRRRRGTRRLRGGNLMDSIAMRTVPYLSTPYPNVIQSLSNSWSGNPTPVPAPSSPVQHTWQPVSNGMAGVINPGAVSNIPDTFVKLASPAPWQTSN